MIKLGALLLLQLSGTLSKLACRTPVVCDPSLESDIFIQSAHFADETQCQTSCTIGHPNNPCKFFTWVPNAASQVPNCYQMKACNEMSDPITGSKSGAWSCDDPEIFCGPLGEIPAYDSKRTTWTCDHNIHPYGAPDKTVFQDTTCRATCPSFELSDGKLQRSDIVVSSTCVAGDVGSVWSAAVPANVIDSKGGAIVSASENPEPECGCKDLVLNGEIQEEAGKVFTCDEEPTINEDGNTVITDSNTCFLECDGLPIYDLYCSQGQWSEAFLQDATEIFCHGGGSTDGQGFGTLSTFWPPGNEEKEDQN